MAVGGVILLALGLLLHAGRPANAPNTAQDARGDPEPHDKT